MREGGRERETEREGVISLSLCATQQDTGHPKASLLIRRKSALPQDFETATALQQYETKDMILASSEES